MPIENVLDVAEIAGFYKDDNTSNPVYQVKSYSNGGSYTPSLVHFLYNEGTKALPTATSTDKYIFGLSAFGRGSSNFDNSSFDILVKSVESFSGTSNKGVLAEIKLRGTGETSSKTKILIEKDKITLGETSETATIDLYVKALNATSANLSGATLTTPTIITPSITTGGTWEGTPTLTEPILTKPTIERDTSANSPTGFIISYGGPSYFSYLSARGTKASPTALQNGDVISLFTGSGYGTGGFDTFSGYLALKADENYGDSTHRSAYWNLTIRGSGDSSVQDIAFFDKTLFTFGSTRGTGSIPVKMGAMTATTGTFAGAVSGVTTLGMSGALSGGTTASFSSTITGNGQYYGNNANNYLDMNTSGNSTLYSRGSVAVMVDNDNNSTANSFFIYNNGSTSDIQFRVAENEAIFYGIPYPNSDGVINIGKAGNRFKDIHATNGTIQTSDIRQKDLYNESPIDYLDFVKNLSVECGKWKDETIPQTIETYYEQKFIVEEKETIEQEFVDGQWQEIKYIDKVKIPVYSFQEIINKDGNKKTELLPVYEAIEKVIPEKTITHDRTHFWFIAQQIKEYLDNKNIDAINFAPLIIDEETGNYGLRYQQFIPILTDVVQQLINRIEVLEGK